MFGERPRSRAASRERSVTNNHRQKENMKHMKSAALLAVSCIAMFGCAPTASTHYRPKKVSVEIVGWNGMELYRWAHRPGETVAIEAGIVEGRDFLGWEGDDESTRSVNDLHAEKTVIIVPETRVLLKATYGAE